MLICSFAYLLICSFAYLLICLFAHLQIIIFVSETGAVPFEREGNRTRLLLSPAIYTHSDNSYFLSDSLSILIFLL
ncbi:MAG TPA: hypothetical protein DEF88_04490 [Porphyromonadaceae bacterium]|nr:hypothetical protein [Porphyromonadaceae bacterium]